MSLTVTKATIQSEHKKIWNLLPWYVNHSLDSTENALVRSHIKTCITCRIELHQQQQLFDKLQQTELLQQMSQTSFAKLKNQIQAAPESLIPAEPRNHQKVLGIFPPQYFGAAKYVALAASLLLLVSPLMFNSSIDTFAVATPELPGEYRTLSNSTESVSKNIVHVAFIEDQLESEQIAAILQGISASIVTGPSSNGIYEIQIGTQGITPQALNEAILQLRNHSLVVFAELAQGKLSSDLD